MTPQVYGIEHMLYIIISVLVCSLGLLLAKKYAKTEKSRLAVIRCIAGLLFVAILTNRLSQVFRYEDVRWYCIIPDSFCGMTSFLLSISALFFKRDNPVYHFLWLLGLFGGISTVVYPTFVSQHQSFFYIPTISGLLHHSLSASLVIALLLFGQIDITYKKWHYVVLGFTSYMTLGAFLMSVFELRDAFHIVEPIIDGTPLTAWVAGPIYLAAHGIVFGVIELVRRKIRVKK